jgi:hypothetical protein
MIIFDEAISSHEIKIIQMIITRYPVFVLLTMLLLSSCQQNDKAAVFYHQINAIYAQENKAVSYFINGQQRSAQTLKADLDKYITEMNELAPFAPGDSLKSAMMEELLMWDKLADLACKKQAPRPDSAAISALTKETLDLQMNRTTVHERVSAENEKLADKFNLEPLNTFVKVNQPTSK